MRTRTRTEAPVPIVLSQMVQMRKYLPAQRLYHHAAEGRNDQLARVLHRELQAAASNRRARHEAHLIEYRIKYGHNM